jgi:excisionase family DNA binding protein
MNTQVTIIPPLLLKVKDAALALAISERKLWELTNREEIPCVRIGRSIRYSLADLTAWIERKRTGANHGPT